MVEMFTTEDFNVFQVAGLEPRMAAIRAEIQPKFQSVSAEIVRALSVVLGTDLPIHIAQHRRRTTNAPDFTWTGMGGDQRGYKKYPHFTLGITENYLVMWLSFIDNPLFEKEMAQAFIDHQELFNHLPADFVINTDHTQNNYTLLAEADLEKALVRWRDVKKGEFQVGRILLKEDVLLTQPEAALKYMTDTYLNLVELYQLSFSARE